MSFIGATGLDEVQEQFDTLNDKIDANADYINNLVGIPDPTHTAVFGINILNPGLFGLVERAEVNIAALQTGEEGLGTDLSALTTQVEGIQGEITGIQGEITTIQGEITGIEGEISLIQFTELPAIVSSIAAVGGVAGDALSKANKSLGIWDEDGNNTYNMKSGNVAIGILPKGTLLNNKLEVNGSINIPTGSSFKINNAPFSYSDLAGTPPVSSKWSNATDVATNIYYSTGNVGIGITTAINNKLEVGGNINIPIGSKYKINNIDLSYNDLTNKLTAGTNISIVSGAINNTLTAGTNISIVSGAINNTLTAGTNISIVSGAINNTYTYTLPTAGIGSGGILGGVKVDNSTITISNGVISAVSTPSGASISLDGSTNNRSYGWTGSTSLLGRVGVAGNYAIGSLVEDVVLRSQGRLLLQSGTNNPALTIETTTNNILVRNSIGIGTTAISAGSLIDVGGFFKVAFNAPADALTLTSSGVQIYTALNVSGTIRFGGFSDDNDLNLATIQNREYATNKSELLIFKGDNIEGSTGVDRIRLRAGAIAFDTFATDATSSATAENIRMYIAGNGNVGIANTAPIAPLTIGNSSLANNDGFIVLEKCTTVGSTRQFRIGLNANFDLAMGDYGGNNVAGTWLESFKISYQSPANALVINSSGNIGINTSNPTSKVHINHSSTSTSPDSGGSIGLYVNNPTNLLNNNSIICNRVAGILSGKVIYSLDVYGAHGWSIYITAISNVFRINNSYTASGTDVLTIDQAGNATISGSINGTGIISSSFLQGSGAGGAYRIVRPDTWVRLKNTADTDHLDFAVGRLYAHYQLDVVGTSTFSAFTIHNAEVRVRMQSVSNTANEYVCIKTGGGTTDGPLGNYYDKILYIAYNTFTGFHRCYVEDELCNDDNIDIFKNDFVGRIVISTGKIKTDASRKKIIENQLEETPDEYEWYSLEDKEGITIEDALPKVQLSRIRKDKRVYGVLGEPNRGTNNKGRIIVNGCGEGAICVCNRNGNIENGDYIQTSDILGYGEKQDDDLLHNYTVAKSVMDCNFELDSPYYQCEELADGTRVAIIACVYKTS